MPTEDVRGRIAHLYRRAGFGARPDELDAAVAAGYEATVDRLLDVDARDPGVDALAPPTFLAAGTVASRQDAQRLSLWWLDRMVAARSPLREKLALFWHSHFATSVQKVKEPELMYAQNQVLRAMGAGSFEALTKAVVQGPAMMIYLDSNQNRRASPNENLSRELLELFTVGIGNYSEDDVKSGARGLTGQQVNRQTGAVTLNPAQHDPGTKTYLGSTGPWTGDDVVHLACTSPACPSWVASRVWSHFARPARPDDPVVAGLARDFARDLDVGRLLRAVFLHREFSAPGTRTGLVKQPVEYVAGTLRALGLTAGGNGQLLPQLAALGQVPFQPPDVGGWPQNTYWLNTSFSLSRLRFASAAAQRADLRSIAAAPVAERPRAVAGMLSVDTWGRATAGALAKAAADPKALVTLAVVAPEYVLA